MSSQIMRRRTFITRATVGAVGVLASTPLRAGKDDSTVIEEPSDGAVLHRRLGASVPGGLKIPVVGRAPEGHQVKVNGSVARREGNRFHAEVVLREDESDITAVASGDNGGSRARVRVVWDRHSRPRYRVAIDDNSFFLRDVVQHGYKSLFDCFYLKMLRDLHSKYRTRFVLNIYFTTGDDFNLTQFPDRYAGEWRDNAEWLKLAFHAHADKPDRPYQDAPAQQVARDFDKVANEIVRFAGEQAYSPTTVVHWGMVRPEAYRPLYDRGVRALSGYFRQGPSGKWDINYRLDDERSEYLSRHDAWKDFESGIVFSKIDIVINSTPVERIVPTLAPLTENPDTAEIMDLLTHEQYFWPFYSRYLPDHAKRLETAIRWVTEKGYEPVFLHEGFLGA